MISLAVPRKIGNRPGTASFFDPERPFRWPFPGRNNKGTPLKKGASSRGPSCGRPHLAVPIILLYKGNGYGNG